MPSTWKTTSPPSAALAAPVRDAGRAIVAAVSVSSTIPYMPMERMREMIPAVQSAAQRISSELGWRPPEAAGYLPGSVRLENPQR